MLDNIYQVMCSAAVNMNGTDIAGVHQRPKEILNLDLGMPTSF